jgi:hypothetical protein
MSLPARYEENSPLDTSPEGKERQGRQHVTCQPQERLEEAGPRR